jgi:hypothetical protein
LTSKLPNIFVSLNLFAMNLLYIIE